MEDLRLGTILLSGGIVDEKDLERCLSIQELTGGVRPLGQILCEQGLLDPPTLERLLALQREQRSKLVAEQIPTEGLTSGALLRCADACGAEEIVVSEGRPVRMNHGKTWRDLTGECLRGPEVWDFVRELLGSGTLEELADRHFVTRPWQIEGCGRGVATAFRQFDGVAVRVVFARTTTPSEPVLPEAFTTRLRAGRGLVLIVGERGAGRTEALEAALQVVANGSPHYVIALGDEPVAQPFSESLVVRRRYGWNTAARAAALRSAVREDPDVLLVGDIGAPETFEIALRAAEGGRLVVAAIDAGRVKDALHRILNFYPAYDLPRIRATLAAVLRAVLVLQPLPNAEQSGVALATELLLVDEPAREILRSGRVDDLAMLLRMEDGSAGHSLDHSMFRLLTAGKVRMQDIFARAEEKAWLLERTRHLEAKEV